MSGILERFFQVTLLLTLILIAMNVSIVTFGEAMTGEDFMVDANVFGGVTPGVAASSVEQTESAKAKPTQDEATWETVIETARELIVGYRPVFGKIFDTIGLSIIGQFLIDIITMLQVVAFAYLFWAVISGFAGGGSP